MRRRDIVKIIAATIATSGAALVGRTWAATPAKSNPLKVYTPAPIKPVTPPDAPLKENTYERLLGAEPTVQVAADGKATIFWKTATPVAGGNVYLGVPTADQQLDYPIYSASTQIKEDQPTTDHQAVVDIKAYSQRFAPEYIEKGEGVIFYRLEMMDSRRGVIRFIDRSFRFIKEGDRFRLGLHLVEGPFIAATTKESATIWWKTDQPSNGEVEIQGKRISSKAVADLHVVTMQGLQPGKPIPTASVVGLLMTKHDRESILFKPNLRATASPLHLPAMDAQGHWEEAKQPLKELISNRLLHWLLEFTTKKQHSLFSRVI